MVNVSKYTIQRNYGIYGDYFINHYKDPYSTNSISWNLSEGFSVAHVIFVTP